MAKKKRKDDDKKAALQAKKDAKQEKAARKRLSKQQKGSSSGDNDTDGGFDAVDEVLLAYKKQNSDFSNSRDDGTDRGSSSKTGSKKSDQQGSTAGGGLKNDKPTLEPLDDQTNDGSSSSSSTSSTKAFPLPRANATLEYCSGKRGSEFIWLFGGEYFDGVENIVLDELLRFDATKVEWKRVVTPSGHNRPPPRCAHSCVSYKDCLYVWGGELATADQYHHYRDLWKFDTSTLEWTEITSRNSPSARSGHVCLVWKHYMVVFGGFFEALRETKWYNDIHVFNLQTEQWIDGIQPSRLSAKPEPRSACNAALYGTDKAIIHGGFSKLKAATTSTNKSSSSSSSSKSTSQSSAPASASETKVHTDAWVLHLEPILQQKPPTWERWIASTKVISPNATQKQNSSNNNNNNTNVNATRSTPNGRAGTSSTSYKHRMITFGGVRDHEQLQHKVDSVFYSDLFVLDIDRRKWFPLKVHNKTMVASSGDGRGNRRRKQKSSKDGDPHKTNDDDDSKDDENDDDDDDSTGSNLLEDTEEDADAEEIADNEWDLDKLRSNMFAFVDGKGNIVYEKIHDDDDVNKVDMIEEEEVPGEGEKVEEKEEEEEKNERDAVVDSPRSSAKMSQHKTQQVDSRKIAASSVMTVNETTNTPEAVTLSEPLPRINATMLVLKQTLYIMGGILEVGDREVTLDDMWSLDLRKRDQWQCLWKGTMHKQVWRGAVHDDDDSYISTSKEEDDSDDEDEDDLSDDDLGDGARGSQKSNKNKRAGLAQEISDLNEKYDLQDENRTPKTSESLADFYARTSSYWNEQAEADAEMSAKERKRAGFGLAKNRYEELTSVLERLAELGIDG